jgi:hypothetical protein
MQVMCFMDVPGPSDFPVGCPVAWLRAGQYAFSPFVVGRGARGWTRVHATVEDSQGAKRQAGAEPAFRRSKYHPGDQHPGAGALKNFVETEG